MRRATAIPRLWVERGGFAKTTFYGTVLRKTCVPYAEKQSDSLGIAPGGFAQAVPCDQNLCANPGFCHRQPAVTPTVYHQLWTNILSVSSVFSTLYTALTTKTTTYIINNISFISRVLWEGYFLPRNRFIEINSLFADKGGLKI